MPVLQCMSRMFNNICRSQALVRFVVCSVLMISELDFVCSFLFALNLYELGWPYQLFLALICIGLFIYFLGITTFGPWNTYYTITKVRKTMTLFPDQFMHENTQVRLETQMFPGSNDFEKRNLTFGDMTEQYERTTKGMEFFRQALSDRNLIFVWDRIEIDNQVNTCDFVHGCPFLRLARFGFMSAPPPKDLGGILNANTLYTFCTGIFQIFIGAVVIYHTGRMDFMNLVPISISCVSLLLTLANVFLNFSSILTSIEAEDALRVDIETRSADDLRRQKQVAQRKRDDEMQSIDQSAEAGEVGFVKKQEAKNGIMATYEVELRDIEDNSIRILDMELDNYVYRLEQLKKSRNPGRGDLKRTQPANGQGQMYIQQKRQYESMIAQAYQSKLTAMEGFKVHDKSADEVEKEFARLDEDCSRKVQIYQKSLAGLDQQFSPAVPNVPFSPAASPAAGPAILAAPARRPDFPDLS